MADVVVVGLDGATWDYLDPLIDEGELGTLARLRDRISGSLETVRPPISCPAWFSYSTGKHPGSLGLWGWRNFDPEAKTMEFNSYEDLPSAELWDHAALSEMESAVINIPTTFPPKRIDGMMVSGMQAEERQSYTEPPELKEQLRRRFGYRVAPDHKMRWDPDEAYEEILELIPKRFEAAMHLVDDVDILHVTVFHIDEIQHQAWGTPELEEAWRLIDEKLGAFLDSLADDTNVIVMSDHGFGPIERRLNVNTVLREEGFLELDSDLLGEALQSIGLTREKLERGLRRTGLLNAAKRLTPRGLQTRIREADGTSSDQRRLPRVDWENTRAFASTNYTVHVADGHVDEVAERLRAIETPEGDPAFEEVLRAEDRFDRLEGPAPDLLLLPSRGIELDAKLEEGLWTGIDEARGDHRPHGIVALDGPAFDPEATLQDARLIDLAPTILHLLECPIPVDMDGDVLDVLATDREPEYTSEQAHRSGYSPQQLEDVEERLRGLGYLGQTGNE